LESSASRLSFSALGYESWNAATSASVNWCPADRERADPHAARFGDHDVGRGGADVDDDGSGGIPGKLKVEGHRVIRGQGAQGQHVGGKPDVLQHGKTLADTLLGDREDARTHIRRIGRDKGLIIPFDLIKREWDLLHRLKLDDVRDLFGLDRGKFGKAGKGGVTGDRDGDAGLAEIKLTGQSAPR
jgi:hypothetical protein